MKKIVGRVLLILLFVSCTAEAPQPAAPESAAPVAPEPQAIKPVEVKSMAELKLFSPAFQYNGNIPRRYTCQGEDVNPPLGIEGIPANAKSFVLILDDPDAPGGNWDHWIVWNIPITSKIEENSVPAGAIQGLNDFQKHEYGGPCPPSGTHRYFFKLYALDTRLSLSPNSRKSDVEKAMRGHISAKTELMGLYKKS